ncbi:light-regulated signal transduction histidine kinase (bacteriophytochrome) [Novosphingobium kunmingense]|uniref:histidine kinase n=1 Tax=Novosphingobium kunmingense TaxID=1211806 RepID=A0A2N0HK03_9SPHN|nr:HWE histidine kinase domain-containing protein [Novosphingobium kunmingense]PKB19283.1 light-regulated signal transduction histidine kinase (bacteriophytochrome) [Novosphingobium kunmingense]
MNEVQPFRVDLTNCDREPIHLLGAIQPLGLLIAFTNDWQVARVSANFADFSGMEPHQALGIPLKRLLEPQTVERIGSLISFLSQTDSVERLFSARLLRGRNELYDCTIHRSGPLIVLEAEPANEVSGGDTSNVVRAMLSRLTDGENDAAFFGEAARIVRGVIEFDRVMVYRFARDGSGHVIAESARSDLVSFLDLHYPASDIPQQARALYLRNPFRVIADVGSTPVAILPQLDETGSPLDLSMAALRSVSPIHIEYLKNMGVAASLSISILVDGKLWGLFACHHYSPKCPPLSARVVAELFGQMFGLRLESRERRQSIERSEAARRAGERIIGAVAIDIERLADAEWLGQTLAEIVPCDGVATIIDDDANAWGSVPPRALLPDLVHRLNAMRPGQIFSTDCLAELIPDAASFSPTAAGMLAIPISRRPRDYVMLFRREQARTVTWGGDPTKPVDYGPNGPRLTPRASFDAWLQEVKGHSAPFSDSEIKGADTLRASLVEVVLQLSEATVDERRRAIERQNLLIGELNHRVRNILALIRSIMRQSRGGETDLGAYLHQIEGRIEALARAHDQLTEQRFAAAGLRQLIETEARAYLDAKSERLTVSGPEIGLSPLAYSTLALVVHELVTNSAKYGALSDSGSVEVTYTFDPADSLRIAWTERGGPPVAPPTRRGFGATVIERAMPHDLGGTATISYPPSGVEAILTIPAQYVEQPQGPIATSSAERRAGISGRTATGGVPETVLLVEDSLLIAMDTEDSLLRAGVGEVRLASSVAHAMGELDARRPDFAVLDLNLGTETSLPIARRLMQMGVPFLFATGYGENAMLDPELQEVPIVVKPYNADSLLRGMGLGSIEP